MLEQFLFSLLGGKENFIDDRRKGTLSFSRKGKNNTEINLFSFEATKQNTDSSPF